MNQHKNYRLATIMIATIMVMLALSLSSAAPALAKATVISEGYIASSNVSNR